MIGLPSDERLKANITNIDGAVTQLARLRPVSFEYRAGTPSAPMPEGLQFGFIAQEIERLYPGMVARDGNGMRHVNYSAFVALLVAAIQQQQRKIADLESRLQGGTTVRSPGHTG